MKKLGLLGLVIVASILTGCASPALTENMVVPAAKLNTKTFDASLKKSMSVADVQGFDKFASFLPAADFKTALSNSLNNAGLAVPSGKGNYAVNAVINNVELPAFALDMKATITVTYVVKDTAGKEVLKKMVVSQGIATAGEAFAGTKRLQMAVERSVQSNIGSFIDALSGFKP